MPTEKNITLILNASEGVLQIVVARDDKMLVHQEWDCPKNATEKLTPLIKDIFQKLDLELSSLSKIALVIGAGSFTGIRLCQQTSAALARVFDAKQVAIDFLHALSFNAPTQKGTLTRVITHAKKNLVHCADFVANEENVPVQIGKTVLVEPMNTLTLANNKLKLEFDYILGSGVEKIRDMQEQFKSAFLPQSANTLNPYVLIFLANYNEALDADIEPKYVRTCDAVDNLEYISTKLGNNPQAAFDKYNEIIES